MAPPVNSIAASTCVDPHPCAYSSDVHFPLVPSQVGRSRCHFLAIRARVWAPATGRHEPTGPDAAPLRGEVRLSFEVPDGYRATPEEHSSRGGPRNHVEWPALDGAEILGWTQPVQGVEIRVEVHGAGGGASTGRDGGATHVVHGPQVRRVTPGVAGARVRHARDPTLMPNGTC